MDEKSANAPSQREFGVIGVFKAGSADCRRWRTAIHFVLIAVFSVAILNHLLNRYFEIIIEPFNWMEGCCGGLAVPSIAGLLFVVATVSVVLLRSTASALFAFACIVFVFEIDTPSLTISATAPNSGRRLMVARSPGQQGGWQLYSSLHGFGVVWKSVQTVTLGHSVNNMHNGAPELLFTPNGQRMFFKRGPIWSDCIWVDREPMKMCAKAPGCCLSGGSTGDDFTDSDGLVRHSKSVELMYIDSQIADERRSRRLP